MKPYEYLFFDVDNTLTRSRQKIAPDLKETLMSLGKEIIIVSGGACEQLAMQMDGVPCFLLGKNGNHAFENEKEIWSNPDLTEAEKQEVFEHVALIPRTWDVPDENDLIDDRGCQVCYSLYGHHAPVATKEQFDPDLSIRKKILKTYPFVSDTVTVTIGGTTTFDYFRKGGTKGDNVARLIEHMRWNKEHAVYFGDRLFEGGNDESVIGVIDTIPVTDPEDTRKKLESMF